MTAPIILAMPCCSSLPAGVTFLFSNACSIFDTASDLSTGEPVLIIFDQAAKLIVSAPFDEVFGSTGLIESLDAEQPKAPDNVTTTMQAGIIFMGQKPNRSRSHGSGGE